jgi:hypothetical protein
MREPNHKSSEIKFLEPKIFKEADMFWKEIQFNLIFNPFEMKPAHLEEIEIYHE